MTGEHGGPARAIAARWLSSFVELPRWIWAAATAVAALCVVVITVGGLAEAEDETRHFGAGQAVRTSTYAITVLDAYTTSEVESEYLEAAPGETLIVLGVRIENLSDTPIGVGSTADLTKANLINTDEPLLELVGVTASDTARAWRPDGSAGEVFLQPDVPSDVVVAWPVYTATLDDSVISIDVHDAEVSIGAVILSSNVVTWSAGEVTARVTVPLREDQ